jgi:hypothetical protein
MDQNKGFLVTLLILLFVSQGCSIQKKRYSGGFSLHFEGRGRDGEPRKSKPFRRASHHSLSMDQTTAITSAVTNETLPGGVQLKQEIVSPINPILKTSIKSSLPLKALSNQVYQKENKLCLNDSSVRDNSKINRNVLPGFGFALLSAVFVGLALISVAPILYILTLAFALISLYFGIRGMLEIYKGKGKGMALAILNILLSILIPIAGAVIIIWAFFTKY